MLKAAPLALAALLAASHAPAGAAEAGFDGTWAVELVTDSGLCSARTSAAVAISAGQLRLASGAPGARVSGRVSPDGSVGLSVSNGTASGTGTGRLGARSGSGTWAVSPLCSGRWTARRGGDRVAQAN